jgi:hypothetical protein
MSSRVPAATRDRLPGMKKAYAFICLILLAAAAVTAQGGKPDLSGTWTLDLTRSDFGQMPPPDSLVSVIEHKEPNIKITTTQKGQQGELTNVRNLTTDGKETVNKVRTMAGEQDVKAITTWKGPVLTTAFSLDAGGTMVDISDAFSLSDDGKVLTVMREIKTPQGDLATKMVFDKK